MAKKTPRPHVTIRMVKEAHECLRGIANETPLQFSTGLSEKHGAKVYLKREDLQIVRSYKLRGAFNRMRHLTLAERKHGIVCASAGNHAQGVAYSCRALKMRGSIFMPRNTPRQKVDRVRVLGNSWVDVKLVGDTFDEAHASAYAHASKKGITFVHPFNDPMVIAGQGTVGVEILQQLGAFPDYVLVPVGGGGLVAGLGTYLSHKSPKTKIIGVEASGAAGMHASLKAGKVVRLKAIDTFVDGAAVKCIGDVAFSLAKKVIDRVVLVPEGRVCQEMIALYQQEGIVTEPAGALSIAALDQLGGSLRGKTVVCVVSGGNNDISRYPEVIERSLVYQGLKHYFIITFSQRPGTLKRYLNEALGPNDDITLFEYVKKNNRESGPALVGIELTRKENLAPLMKRMKKIGMSYELLPPESAIFRFLT